MKSEQCRRHKLAKKAEEATPKDDYETLGYINMQLGIYTWTLTLKTKKTSENTKSTYILHKITQPKTMPSAERYYWRLIPLCQHRQCMQIPEQCHCTWHKSQRQSVSVSSHRNAGTNFYQDSNYLKSKNLALYAITEGSDHCPADEAIHDAARAYAQLGRFDSANFSYPASNSTTFLLKRK